MSDSTKKLLELYNLMEEKLEDLGIDFEEFIVLYKSFRNPPTPKSENPNPFPWAQAAGTGWK